MNIGSLYTVKDYFWLLFPTKETSTAQSRRPLPDWFGAPLVATGAAYWSKRYNCNVTYFSPDSYIVFLEEDTKFKKVLTSDGRIGWTWFDESYNHSFKEVKEE